MNWGLISYEFPIVSLQLRKTNPSACHVSPCFIVKLGRPSVPLGKAFLLACALRGQVVPGQAEIKAVAPRGLVEHVEGPTWAAREPCSRPQSIETQ